MNNNANTDLSSAVKTLTEIREQIASHQAQIKVLRKQLNLEIKSAQQRLTIASGGSIRKSRPRVKRSRTTDVVESWDADQDELLEEYDDMDMCEWTILLRIQHSSLFYHFPTS